MPRDESTVLLDRFTLGRRLGAGGMGEVFDAFDELFEERVALKVLKRDSPKDVDQFKREFRSIAELRHPNLVPLYEFFLENSMCFFTMELLSGYRLTELPPLPETAGPTGELLRLGSILYQASLGLDAIHARGWMHLDLKPENMLWTSDGRVVILDLGLARPTRWDPHAAPRAGTVPFMAPEQVGGTAFPASDWYGLGATLYTVFSQRYTFHGPQDDVLHRKQVERPLPVGSLCSVDPRLCAIVDDLLALEPEARPNGPQLRARLRAMGIPAPEPEARPTLPALELHAEQRAAIASWGARPQTALLELRGPSGVGKTIFVENLLEDHRERLVLRSCCRPEEHVPFKALDGPMEQICDWLLTVEDTGWRAGLVGSLPHAVFQVFPALLRLPGCPPHLRLPADRAAALEEAFFGVCGLFEEVCELRPILLWVDSYQWVDADSSPLLLRLLRSVPRGLLVLLSGHLEMDSLPRADYPFELIQLKSLTRQSFEQAMLGLLPAGLEEVWQQSGGLPFLLMGGVGGEGARRRLAALGAEERRMMELSSLAVGDLPLRVLLRALGETRGRRSQSLRRLVDLRLIRWVGGRGGLSPTHDQLRLQVCDDLSQHPAHRNELHKSLVVALLEEPSSDLQALFVHCLGAGMEQEALHYAREAAEAAESNLAFGTAARLYERILTLEGGSPQLWMRLAVCRRNTGALPEAAAAWEKAALLLQEEGEAELLDTCRWRAAEAWLHSGRWAEGRKELGAVLQRIGVKIPASSGWALLRASWFRARYFLGRWLGLHRRRTTSPGQEYRLDRLWSASTAFSMVEPLLSDALGAEHLLRVAAVSDAGRRARALGYEAAFEAAFGGRLTAVAERHLQEAFDTLPPGGAGPYDRAWLKLCACAVSGLQGRTTEAVAHGREAEQLFRLQCQGAEWEVAVLRNYLYANLWYSGEILDLQARLRAFDQSTARTQPFAASVHRLGMGAVARVVGDEAEETLKDAQELLDAWPARGFSTQHYFGMQVIVEALLYLGQPQEACDHAEKTWGLMNKAGFLSMEWVRNESLFLRARAHAMLRCSKGLRGVLPPPIAEALRSLDACPQPYARAFAALLRATDAAFTGQEVAEKLRAASATAQAAGLPILHLAAEHRLAIFLADVNSKYSIECALRARGVVHPQIFLCGMLPWPEAPRSRSEADPQKTRRVLTTI